MSNKKAATPPDGDEELRTSDLKRLDPDSILADEADPDALLGNESDSETGESRRASRNFDAATENIDLNGDGGHAVGLANATAAHTAAVEAGPTPTQMTFSKKETAMTEAELKAQLSDLQNQVTGLNNKLDEVSESQNHIAAYTTKISELEKEREEHLAALNTGLLVEKEHVSQEMQRMMDRVIEETTQRGKAISDKEKIEAELDELSSKRLSRARAEEKSRQMEERLKDTEEIMEHQQKRLAELQTEVERRRADDTNESSGAGAPQEITKSDHASGTGLIQLPPLSSSSRLLPLLEQELMLDIVPYIELRAFLNHLRRLRQQLAPFYTYPLPGVNSSVHGRSHSNSPMPSRTSTPGPAPEGGKQVIYPGMNPAYGVTANGESSPRQGVSRHKDYPSLPSNCEQLRSVEEDSDPCLRLDFAPGLNWLSRRQMHSALLDGGLVIEPISGGGTKIDEQELRTRYSSMPPAACAMCGKAGESVPTSTTSNWINAANSAASSLQAAVASSGGLVSPGSMSGQTTPSASSIAASSSTNATSANLTTPGTPDPSKSMQKQRSGLFSSLRHSMGGSPRPSLGASNTTASTNTSTGVFLSADDASSSEHDGASGAQGLVEEDLFSPHFQPLVVPTHIFRITETSSTRYLLCPQHCLRRLRAACAFWGYVRNLERAVVLEGKLAWDDMRRDQAREEEERKTSKGDETPRATITEEKEREVEEANEDNEEKEKEEEEKEEEKEKEMGTRTQLEEGDGVDASEARDGETGEKESEEKGPESSADKNSDSNSNPAQSTTTAISVSDEDEDEGGFADAISSHSSPVITKTLEMQKENTDVTELAKDEKGETKGNEETETEEEEKEAKISEEAAGTSKDPEAKGQEAGEKSQLPPLPARRSNNRSPAPPALPPRTKRPPPVLPARSSDVSPTPSASLAKQIQRPPPRKTLPLNGGKGGEEGKENRWTWEEKVWCEVTRLKAEMWLARIGVTETETKAERLAVEAPRDPDQETKPEKETGSVGGEGDAKENE
ncbi:hypothetical protein FA10DRAFT_275575 [Acaromyces ingoldii]|uniref:GDP/GTP exchange factor Sec2 N-terminal domain-containing protein n=1 Tax=Acaromyces ingoldii TaxID=215250 RepID=A0A316YJ02_9BASI|nr:hypothetical protein FA10DRAFT_275575 [Acaromyces ingoldii]PWN89172.1 hypothetical protein FA10DRAFT_275575 [Acaromyces ingoldii]